MLSDSSRYYWAGFCDFSLQLTGNNLGGHVYLFHTVTVQAYKLWERLVLMDQYKISVAIGSFSVPPVPTHFSA